MRKMRFYTRDPKLLLIHKRLIIYYVIRSLVSILLGRASNMSSNFGREHSTCTSRPTRVRSSEYGRFSRWTGGEGGVIAQRG